jgi:hypothetical protein
MGAFLPFLAQKTSQNNQRGKMHIRTKPRQIRGNRKMVRRDPALAIVSQVYSRRNHSRARDELLVTEHHNDFIETAFPHRRGLVADELLESGGENAAEEAVDGVLDFEVAWRSEKQVEEGENQCQPGGGYECADDLVVIRK